MIFGWAGGTHAYTLRLAGESRDAALKAGAMLTRRYGLKDSIYEVDLRSVGDDWVFGNWAKDEELWCLDAYETAGRSK